MELSKEEILSEEKRLAEVIELIRNKISVLGQELYEREEDVLEFKKFMWDSRSDMDPTELKTMMSSNDLEISMMMKKGEYLQKIFKIQNKPYFGRIDFDDGTHYDKVYIGITHLIDDNNNYYIHDWRSPICNLFYDYEIGKANYLAPMRRIYGEIKLKRQYTIEDGKLKHIFDNNINISDELLQEVLAKEDNDKMRNIVNTIQAEQNKVIRDIENKNLIVQGIAGSGKTSVALHRIAFLLYKIKNLNSDNVLIFSPNKLFSEYISNVLPELGEKNTMQTTINDFLDMEIKEFKKVESFTSFIERSYQQEIDYEFIKYKQSDTIYKDIDKYIDNISNKTNFIEDLFTRDYSYTKKELNEMFKKRYSKFNINDRLEFMANKISEINYNGSLSRSRKIKKELQDRLNIKINLLDIYINFFNSEYSKIKRDISSIKNNKKIIYYDDACLYVYIKCLIYGYNYNTNIKEIVIDEAQDYSLGQINLIKRIFKNASYTILGDINQTINPYYKYNSLKDITKILDDSKYIELTKTYRSSQEIVEFSNEVLGLKLSSAIRRNEVLPVLVRTENNLLDELNKDINILNNRCKSIAIITKNQLEVDKIYNLLKDRGISKIDNNSNKFNRKFIVIPVYMAKGLEFDGVIIYNELNNKYKESEKYLYYVAITRAQHQLIIYNN